MDNNAVRVPRGRAGARQRSDRTRARGWLTLATLLRPYLRPHIVRLCLIVILLAAQSLANLYLPSLNADLINNGVLNGNVGYIWRTGAFMLVAAIAVSVFSIGTVYLVSRASMAVGASLRADVYRRVQGFSAREMSRFGVPTLVTRTINDVQQIQVVLETMLGLLTLTLFMSVGALVMAVREGPRLSILIAVALPLMAAIVAVTLAVLLPLLRNVQAQTDRINQVLREQVNGIRVIRAFLRTGSERDRFGHANADLTATSRRVTRIVSVIGPSVTVMASLSGVGIVWFGGRLVGDGSLSIGNMTAFLIYLQLILMYAAVAVAIFIPLPRAVASAERIGEVIRAVPAVADPPRPVIPAAAVGAIEFRNATFGYPGSRRPVLTDVSFTLRPGQVSGIIGRTGSGKTTTLGLITRFFTPTEGAVLVNGTDVRDQEAERLWAGIGLVPQTAFLFAGTVASNLRFGTPDATDEQLWNALDVAQAVDFVAAMPGQLDAPIDQGGANVSGGQRQRLSIARALLRRPRLYLFDDCFSALDAGTDARLRAALRTQTQDATILMVAQRVRTVMHADQVIVLDSGAIAGIGTHEQLLRDCGIYQEIVASQLGEGAAA